MPTFSATAMAGALLCASACATAAHAQQAIVMPVIYQGVYILQGAPAQPPGTYFGQPTRTVRTTTTTGGTFYRQVPVPGPIIRTSTLRGRHYVQPPLAYNTFTERHRSPTVIQPYSYAVPQYR